MIKGKYLLAFDGTHASGKTTLIYQIAARLREKGINCVVLPEPARNNPLVDDVVLREIDVFDIPLEIDLIMNHISQCIRGTRNSEIILSDRTPVNVLAYTNLLISSKNQLENNLLDKCNTLTEVWVKFYDLIFYCQDHYTADIDTDNLRSKVVDMQNEVDVETRKQYEKFGCDIRFIPKGLSLDKKADFVLETIKKSLSLEI